MSQPDSYAQPQTQLSPTQERTMGAVAHGAPLVAMVLSAGLLGFVGSLVIYLMYKDRGPFVRAHAANSLNVQIMTGIVLLISLPLMLVLIGFVTYPPPWCSRSSCTCSARSRRTTASGGTRR